MRFFFGDDPQKAVDISEKSIQAIGRVVKKEIRAAELRDLKSRMYSFTTSFKGYDPQAPTVAPTLNTLYDQSNDVTSRMKTLIEDDAMEMSLCRSYLMYATMRIAVLIEIYVQSVKDGKGREKAASNVHDESRSHLGFVVRQVERTYLQPFLPNTDLVERKDGQTGKPVRYISDPTAEAQVLNYHPSKEETRFDRIALLRRQGMIGDVRPRIDPDSELLAGSRDFFIHKEVWGDPRKFTDMFSDLSTVSGQAARIVQTLR